MRRLTEWRPGGWAFEKPRRLLRRAGAVGCVALALAGARASDHTAALPSYQPERLVWGPIQCWGDTAMAPLLDRWERGFRAYQPGICFTNRLKGTASALMGLDVNVADLALMGRKAYTYETYGIYRRSLMLPVAIAVATGSFDAPHKSYALTIFVHRGNPLQRLTVAQLDGIFGAKRTGGWQGLKWNRKVARGSGKNIRTWGQLGLTGAWADRPIHVYGPPGIYPGGTSFFQSRVMGGADTWNAGLREYADPRKMMAALSRDPDGIAYTGMCYRTPEVKALAIADHAGGPYVIPTRSSVANRSYPLVRLIYIYFAPDSPSGDPATLRPKIREFLRYILSRQGQEAVARDGDFLPLTSGVDGDELVKLAAAAAGGSTPKDQNPSPH